MNPTIPKTPAMTINPHSERVGTLLGGNTQILLTVFESKTISVDSLKNEATIVSVPGKML